MSDTDPELSKRLIRTERKINVLRSATLTMAFLGPMSAAVYAALALQLGLGRFASHFGNRRKSRASTRLTAAHSKKLVNHIHMVALYTVWYNFARISSAVKCSPAMAAGLPATLWDVGDIVEAD